MLLCCKGWLFYIQVCMCVMRWTCRCDDKLVENVGCGWPVIWMTLNKWSVVEDQGICVSSGLAEWLLGIMLVSVSAVKRVRLNLPLTQLQSRMNNAFSTTESLRSIEQHHSCGYVLQTPHFMLFLLPLPSSLNALLLPLLPFFFPFTFSISST